MKRSSEYQSSADFAFFSVTKLPRSAEEFLERARVLEPAVLRTIVADKSALKPYQWRF